MLCNGALPASSLVSPKCSLLPARKVPELYFGEKNHDLPWLGADGDTEGFRRSVPSAGWGGLLRFAGWGSLLLVWGWHCTLGERCAQGGLSCLCLLAKVSRDIAGVSLNLLFISSCSRCHNSFPQVQREEGSNIGQRRTDKQLGPQSCNVSDAGVLWHVCLFYWGLDRGSPKSIWLGISVCNIKVKGCVSFSISSTKLRCDYVRLENSWIRWFVLI